MARWYLIKNSRNIPCKNKAGEGCGKVHPYMSHKCRPVAFDNPREWEFFYEEVLVDKGITLAAKEKTMYSSRLGEVVEITEQEALDLNVIRNPPSSPVVVAKSFPGSPTRRSGGVQAPPGRRVGLGGMNNGR